MDTDKRCKSCGGRVTIEIVTLEKGGTAAVGTCQSCGRRYEEEELLTLTGSAGPVGG
jgi:transcription elongation factor Elf1